MWGLLLKGLKRGSSYEDSVLSTRLSSVLCCSIETGHCWLVTRLCLLLRSLHKVRYLPQSSPSVHLKPSPDLRTQNSVTLKILTMSIFPRPLAHTAAEQGWKDIELGDMQATTKPVAPESDRHSENHNTYTPAPAISVRQQARRKRSCARHVACHVAWLVLVLALGLTVAMIVYYLLRQTSEISQGGHAKTETDNAEF